MKQTCVWSQGKRERERGAGGCKTLTRVIQIKLEAYEKCVLFRSQTHMERPHRREAGDTAKPHEKKIETTFHFPPPDRRKIIFTFREVQSDVGSHRRRFGSIGVYSECDRRKGGAVVLQALMLERKKIKIRWRKKTSHAMKKRMSHIEISLVDIQSYKVLQCWSYWGKKVYVFKKKKWIKYCLIFEQFCMQVEGFLSLLLFLYFVMLQQIESFLIAIWCHFTLSVTPLLFPWMLFVWWSYPRMDIKLEKGKESWTFLVARRCKNGAETIPGRDVSFTFALVLLMVGWRSCDGTYQL